MIRQTNKLACVLVCLIFLAGCGGGGDTSTQSTGGLSFKLQFIDSAESAAQQLNAEVDICTAYEISEIRAALSRMDGSELASATWPCEDHRGVLDGVAPTSNLVLLVEGFVGDELRWRGQKAGIEILPGEITPAGEVQMINITDDTTAPQVLSTSPLDGATAVPINAVITVDFNEPVSALFVNDAFLLTDDGSNQVNGDVSYEESNDDQFWRAKFVPAANLKKNTQYTMTLLNVVQDLAGNTMAAEHTWRFTTGSTALEPLIWGKGKWGKATWQ
jgi:hypothetical protein